jgi:3-oxoacyl-[acyl-carrier-protein] synthase II
MAVSPTKNDVVITGMGVACPLGMSVSSFKERMFAGDSGIIDIRDSLVGPKFPIPYAGYIDRSEIKQLTSDYDSISDSSRMALIASKEACNQLTSKTPIDAIVYGSAEGIAFDLIQKAYSLDSLEGLLTQSLAEAPLVTIQKWLKSNLKLAVDDNQLICINSACASGNQAIGDAMQRIRSGEWTRALVGGVDSRCTASNLMNFHMLGALCSEDIQPSLASRPFSKDRAGFVRSEGAATLILESREAAEARGAKILGVVSGYSMTSDAYRLTDGRDDVLCVKEAMLEAIKDADLSVDDIDAVSAHGTSTPLNDKLETKAIKAVFPNSAAIPVTSLKSQIGHSTVAAGAVEAIACLLMMESNTLAPTINYREQDPECDLDYVPNVSRPYPINHMLSNNFGFGGQNTCLVISRDQI